MLDPARRLKAGFVPPCLPRPAREPPAGPGWIHEIKHDGFRILARKDTRGVRLFTRNGYDFAARLPMIAAAVEGLPVGLSVFNMLRYRRHDDIAMMLCAFDLIELGGKSLRRMAIEHRKQPDRYGELSRFDTCLRSRAGKRACR
jgi:bifunctional non-homologous end joining protein LigD